jgi:hypothetical protein
MELMMRPSLLCCHTRGLGFIPVHGSELLPHVPAFFREHLLDVGKLPPGMGYRNFLTFVGGLGSGQE